MRIIACLMLVAGAVAARTTEPVAVQTDQAAGTPALTPDPSPTAGAAATPSASPAPTPPVRMDNVFGPGLNNPLALPPNPLILQQAKRIADKNPNILVFVGTQGEVKFTDRFGQEVDEILDEFGRDVSELLDPQEAEEQLLANRRQELERRRQQLNLQLLQEFKNNPTSFDTVGGGAAPGAQPSFRVVV